MFGTATRLMDLDGALAALGPDGISGRRRADVPLALVTGSAARTDDFDAGFRLRNKRLRDRWQRVAEVVARGEDAPVELVQLGELYFVLDGHHRVSAALAQGRPTIVADVLHLCTVAFGMACLRAVHLPSKAAERRFLDRVPLPDRVRADLWLDDPADWSRLADAAEAWGFRQGLAGCRVGGRDELAANWWVQEVEPVLARVRAAGVLPDLRAVEVYVAVRAARERHDWTSWPPAEADLATLGVTG